VAYPIDVQDMQEKILIKLDVVQAGRAETYIEFPAGSMAGYQWIKTDMNGYKIWISMEKKG
jgi:hypothetical protein